jgi:hypothetical protein
VSGWLIPAGLGAYHGLNPAMGWLFAVALGLQDRRASTLFRALPPIALGHAASVTIAIILFEGAAVVVSPQLLRIGSALILFAFAANLAFNRKAHPRWVGMRIRGRELIFWSFLMSSAHGAGLMLFPVVNSQHHHAASAGGFTIVGIHSAAMLASMSAAAICVFYASGVGFLRRGWVNLEFAWVAALVLAGVMTLVGY